MKTLHLVLISCGLSFLAPSYARPVDPTVPALAPSDKPTVICRDFDTMKNLELPLCDYVMTNQLKTNLLSLLITEQKNIDTLLNNTSLPMEKIYFYRMIKDHLSSIERFAIQKISDICAIKGRLILQTPGLISGCTYNQLAKMKFTIGLLQKNIYVGTAAANTAPSEEQKKFDVFINDLLFDLAEKNRNYYPDNAAYKTLMAEVLKIYGGDGKSLYASFLGICGLASISKTPPSSNSKNFITECEAAYLTDLRQTLFLAI